jgi:hypothetical protein
VVLGFQDYVLICDCLIPLCKNCFVFLLHMHNRIEDPIYGRQIGPKCSNLNVNFKSEGQLRPIASVISMFGGQGCSPVLCGGGRPAMVAF